MEAFIPVPWSDMGVGIEAIGSAPNELTSVFGPGLTLEAFTRTSSGPSGWVPLSQIWDIYIECWFWGPTPVVLVLVYNVYCIHLYTPDTP